MIALPIKTNHEITATLAYLPPLEKDLLSLHLLLLFERLSNPSRNLQTLDVLEVVDLPQKRQEVLVLEQPSNPPAPLF